MQEKQKCKVDFKNAQLSQHWSNQQQKPLVIYFYNKKKCEVDVVDQMIRQYLTHTASCRWPLGQIFWT